MRRRVSTARDAGIRELLEPLNRTKHPLAGALSLQNNFAGGVAVGKYVAGSQCSKRIHLSRSDKTSGRARDNPRLYSVSHSHYYPKGYINAVKCDHSFCLKRVSTLIYGLAKCAQQKPPR